MCLDTILKIENKIRQLRAQEAIETNSEIRQNLENKELRLIIKRGKLKSQLNTQSNTLNNPSK